LLPLILAVAVHASSAAVGDPGETALEFLEKVRARDLNLAPGGDTALSPHTSESKRVEISRRLERMARDLGTEPLELGPVKLDDDLAAVLVRKAGGFDPSGMQVFPIALVRRGAGWSAAPVPASFENSGVGYAAAVRKRLDALQEWMLHEQARDLEQLREQAATRMRRNIAESISADTLRGLGALETAERYLAACAKRKLPEMLGLLGGLAAELPEDWPVRLKTADAAVRPSGGSAGQGRALLAPEVLRAVVLHEEEEHAAMVSVVFLDPAGNPRKSAAPRLGVFHLALSKTQDGFWRIDPPAGALANFPSEEDEDDGNLDSDLLDAFPGKVATLAPPSRTPQASEALQTLVSALNEETLAPLMRLIRLDGPPKEARSTCLRAARLWWRVRDPASVRRPLLLAIQERGERFAAAFQLFSVRNPDQLELAILYFEKSADGWYWTPKAHPETEQAFRDWAALQAEKWPDDWQQAVLADSTTLDSLAESAAPTAAEARQVVEAWFRAVRGCDIAGALRLTARLNSPDSRAALFRNLGYEMAGGRRNSQASMITGDRSGGCWTTVGAKTMVDGKPNFPLYPVVNTPSGPRILLEIDLTVSGNRSREFLNRTALDRLRKTSPAAAEELKRLFSAYQAEVAMPDSP
jgi:hypothetical protein